MPDRTLRVSVIVCAHNEEARLEDCLTSLIAQSFEAEAFEIVMVDDGSTDRTAEIGRRVLFEGAPAGALRCRLIRIEHAGLSRARNVGIRFSGAPLVAFVDGDAIPERDWVREIAKAFSSQPAVGVVGGRTQILNESNVVAGLLHRFHYDESDKREVVGTNMAFRRSVFEEHGGFFSCFRSRGDETAVVGNISQTYYSVVKASEARVRHERPEHLPCWLRERLANGRFYAWFERLSEGNRIRLAKGCFKRAVTFSPVGFIPLSLVWPILFVFALPGLVAIARRVFRGRFQHHLQLARESHGKSRGRILTEVSIGLVLTIVGDGFSDVGYLMGVFENPGPGRPSRSLIDPAVTVIDVVESSAELAHRPLSVYP